MVIKEKLKKEKTELKDTTSKFNFIDFFNNYKNILIIITIVALVFSTFLLLKNNLKQQPVSSKDGLNIKLLGASTITIESSSDFLDPGYTANDKEDGDLTNNVQVLGIIDFNIPGTYERYYTVENSSGTVVETKRTIIITETDENETILTLTLKGNSTIELKKGTKYIEPGYTAHDELGTDLTKDVNITSNLDINRVGTYKITYILSIGENIKELTRTIKVVETPKTEEVNIDANLSVNKTDYTNTSVRIALSITGNGYSYTILPNQMKSLNKNIIYTVSSNGTYVFNIYDKNGGVKTIEKTISNIDTETPEVTCTGEIKDDNKTYLKVTAYDDDLVLKYVYKSNGIVTSKLTTNTYIINSRTKTANVTVYDQANNNKNTICNIIGDLVMIYPQIKPVSNKDVVKKYSADSETLKIITEKKGSYYLIRIWAKNPYKQLHRYASTDYNKRSDNFGNIFDHALKNIGKGDIAIGFNGNVHNDYYSSRNLWDKYDWSGLIIHEGKLLRNDPISKKSLRLNICWIDKNNQFHYINDKKSSIVNRTKMYNDAISSGILNTFSATRIARDGVNIWVKRDSHYKSYLQGFCQIDLNNYIYISTTKYYWGGELADLMIKLGCKDGYQIDAGGSLNQVFKKANSTKWDYIRGSGSRGPSWAITYWTEI